MNNKFRLIAPKNFKTKLILLITLSLGMGLLIMILAAWLSLQQLSRLATAEVEKGLLEANSVYFRNYIDSNVRRVEAILRQQIAEIQILTALLQELEDNPTKYYVQSSSKLEYNLVESWFQTEPSAETSVSLVPTLLNTDGTIKPEVWQVLQQSNLFELFAPVVNRYGANKIRINYYGSPATPFIRSAPWFDFVGTLRKAFPQNYKEITPWYFVPAGLKEAWEGSSSGLKTQITFTTPYFDLQGQRLLATMYQPVWDKARQKLQGVVSISVSLSQIADLVNNLKIAENSFAFLVQGNGQILALQPNNLILLNMPVTGTLNSLKDSGLANLSLPPSGQVSLQEVTINRKDYQLILSSLSPLTLYKDGVLQTDVWTLGFVIPKEVLLTLRKATEASINANSQQILWFVVLVSISCLLLLVLGVLWLTYRFTAPLTNLTKVAVALQKQNYEVQIDITPQDELGALGRAFSQMVQEIKQHNQKLEQTVQQRTLELEQANQQINLLNLNLEAENFRMRAELIVTRRLQEMILPKDQELHAITPLEIAGYSEAAAEVGGDYFDVIQNKNLVKIGIGDVTGHGLESGVLMIMVQTAVRTLLAIGETDPVRCLEAINQTIYANVKRMQSTRNLSLSLLSYQEGLLELSGQHENLIIIRQNGQLELIDTLNLGFPIGLERNILPFIGLRYIPLSSGDTVILYTDGITEATNSKGELYGIEQLLAVVLANFNLPVIEIKDAIIADVHKHIGSIPLYDDITLLVFRLREGSNP